MGQAVRVNIVKSWPPVVPLADANWASLDRPAKVTNESGPDPWPKSRLNVSPFAPPAPCNPTECMLPAVGLKSQSVSMSPTWKCIRVAQVA